MKIVVYAIAKNEGFFVDRWMDSMSEADQVVVLDTGSDDGTAERLRARGAQVTVERIVPWRFDRARNRSLELVPEDADVCVCTDLDEVFHPGWRSALERAWTPGTRQASYRYTWSFQPDGSEGVVFWQEKIHARRGFRWVHPVHEVLEWVGGTAGVGPGGPAGPPPGPPKIPGTVPAPAGAVGGGGPGGRPEPPLSGPGVPLLRPVGRLYPHPDAASGSAQRRLAG